MGAAKSGAREDWGRGKGGSFDSPLSPASFAPDFHSRATSVTPGAGYQFVKYKINLIPPFPVVNTRESKKGKGLHINLYIIIIVN